MRDLCKIKQTITFAGQAAPFVQTYKYDSLYRITEAKEQNGTSGTTNWQQSYGYDRYGNRTGFAQNLGGQATPINSQTLPQVEPTTNRFTDTSTYHYDKNGNITNDATSTAGARNFVFNGDNKQTEVKDSSGNVIGKYFYDGEGKRVKKLTALDSTIFVYSAGKLVAEYSTNAPPEHPTTNYVHTDTLQSVRAISDKQGNIISRRDFMPFGEEIYVNTANRTVNDKYTSGQDAVRQRFTSYEKDIETGLDFAEARYYNNAHGRFTAIDPLLASGKSANPQTFNRYVYCLNSPLILSDSSGMQVGSAKGEVYRKRINGGWNYAIFEGSIRRGYKRVSRNINGTTTINGGVYSVTITPNSWTIGNSIDNVKQKNKITTVASTKTQQEEKNTLAVAPAAVDTSDSRFNSDKGPPNDWENLGHRWRLYDENGLPLLDIDYHDGEPAGNPHAHWWDWQSGQNPIRSEAQPIPDDWAGDQENEDGEKNLSPFYYQGIRWDLFGEPLEVVEPGQPVHFPGAVPIDSPPIPTGFPLIPPLIPGTRFPLGSPAVVPQPAPVFSGSLQPLFAG